LSYERKAEMSPSIVISPLVKLWNQSLPIETDYTQFREGVSCIESSYAIPTRLLLLLADFTSLPVFNKDIIIITFYIIIKFKIFQGGFLNLS